MFVFFSRSTHSIRLTTAVHLVVVATGAASKLTQRKLDLRPPLSEKRKREITDKIAEFIALDMRPVNVVDGEGFKELMRTPEPGYTVPKRETVMHAVDAKYASMRAEVAGSFGRFIKSCCCVQCVK